MATTQDVAEFIVKTNDQELALAVKREEDSLADLQRQLAANAIGFAEFDKRSNATIATLGELRAQQQRLAASSDELTSVVGKQMNAIYAAEGAMEEFQRGAERAATSLHKVGAASAGVAKGAGSLNQSITAGSYAFQDFTSTSGDLGAKLNSITNNLPQLLVGLGGLGTVISVTATAAVALYRNWDEIDRFFRTKSPFPQAAADVAGMKAELDKAKEATKALGEHTDLTAGELVRYNELRARTADLEKRIGDETERQQRLKRAAESQTTEDKERGSANAAAVAGKVPEVLVKLEAALAKRTEEEIRKMQETANESMAYRATTSTSTREDAEFARWVQRGVDEAAAKLRANLKTNAERVLDEFLKGSKKGTEDFMDLAVGRGISFGTIPDEVEKNSPEAKAAAKAAKARGEAEKKALAAKKAADDLIDELNVQGQTNEAWTRAGGEKADARAARDASKEHKQAAAEAHKRQVEHDKRFDAATRQIGGGGLEAQAELLVAQHLANGGNLDANGKLSRRDFDALTERIVGVIRRANPNMHPLAASTAGMKIASQAESGVSGKLMGVAGAGLSAHEATQQVLLSTQAQVGSLMRRLQSVEATNRQLTTNARTLSRNGLKR